MHHQSRCFVPAATPTCFIRFSYLSLRPQLHASSPTKPHATLDIKLHIEPDTPLSHDPGLEVFLLYRDDSKRPADAQPSDDATRASPRVIFSLAHELPAVEDRVNLAR